MKLAKKKLTDDYLSSLCAELALVLKSGMPIGEGIDILLEEERDTYVVETLTKVRDVVLAGAPFYEGLTATDAFPHYLCEMVAIGERTGNLERVLNTLAKHYGRQAETARAVRSAVLYPSVLLGMLLFVIVILITKVLPVFEDVYRQLGTSMTGVSAAVMRFGAAIERNWIVIVAVLAALIVAAVVLLRTKSTRASLLNFIQNKKMKQLSGEVNFASSMAMAVAGGFDLDEALEMSQKLSTSEAQAAAVAACRKQVSEGEAVSKAVLEQKILEGRSAQMLRVGIRTGTTDQALEDIAERSQVRLLDEVESVIGKIEPTLVIVMSVLVGAILLMVMLPLAGVLTSL